MLANLKVGGPGGPPQTVRLPPGLPIIVLDVPAIPVGVYLVVPDVADLSVECPLVAGQIGRIPRRGRLPPAADIFIKPNPIACDVGPHRVYPRRVGSHIAVICPKVLPVARNIAPILGG